MLWLMVLFVTNLSLFASSELAIQRCGQHIIDGIEQAFSLDKIEQVQVNLQFPMLKYATYGEDYELFEKHLKKYEVELQNQFHQDIYISHERPNSLLGVEGLGDADGVVHVGYISKNISNKITAMAQVDNVYQVSRVPTVDEEEAQEVISYVLDMLKDMGVKAKYFSTFLSEVREDHYVLDYYTSDEGVRVDFIQQRNAKGRFIILKPASSMRARRIFINGFPFLNYKQAQDLSDAELFTARRPSYHRVDDAGEIIEKDFPVESIDRYIGCIQSYGVNVIEKRNLERAVKKNR